jgi:hypothetical protein
MKGPLHLKFFHVESRWRDELKKDLEPIMPSYFSDNPNLQQKNTALMIDKVFANLETMFTDMIE